MRGIKDVLLGHVIKEQHLHAVLEIGRGTAK